MDMHISRPTREGFNKFNEIKIPMKISSTTALSSWEARQYSEEGLQHQIRYDLCKNLAEQLFFEQDLVTIEKTTDRNHDTKYRAEITVVPYNFKQVILEDNVFELRGKRFTEDEIKEALLDYFPHRFIV